MSCISLYIIESSRARGVFFYTYVRRAVSEASASAEYARSVPAFRAALLLPRGTAALRERAPRTMFSSLFMLTRAAKVIGLLPRIVCCLLS